MNSYTDKSQFLEDAQFILDTSDLLIKENCLIVDDVLYERLEDDDNRNSNENYRFFFECGDYDYLDDQDMIDRLNQMFIMIDYANTNKGVRND